MRTSIILLAASSCLASARWVKWEGGRDLAGMGVMPRVMPRETGSSAIGDASKGWTPKPTNAPGQVSGSKAVLELFLRRDEERQKRASSSNTWEDATTCGWSSGSSSAPWTCEPSSTCATNTDSVVACVSGTYSPFFTVCLNYEAFQQGACNSIGPATGCCQTSSFGECGTFLWSSPARSMFRCFPTATIIPMIDEPQFVLDSLTSSSSRTSHSSISVSTTTSSSISSTTTSSSGGSSSGSNTGAIVGGVVGGLAAVAILAGLLVFCILRRKSQKNKNAGGATSGGKNGAYDAVPPSDPAYSAQHQQGLRPTPSPDFSTSHNSASMTSYPGATTFPPTSPYPHGNASLSPGFGQQSIAGAVAPGREYAAYDPRVSTGGYYDPPKPPASGSPGSGPAYQPQQQYGAAYAPYASQQQQYGQGPHNSGLYPQPSPGLSPPEGAAAGSNPHHSVELDASQLSQATKVGESGAPRYG